ncbi:hypothetical protein V6Z11_A13G156400 [Gossypium hirsutum]
MVARREEQVISLLFLYTYFETQENKRKGLHVKIFVSFCFSIDRYRFVLLAPGSVRACRRG